MPGIVYLRTTEQNLDAALGKSNKYKGRAQSSFFLNLKYQLPKRHLVSPASQSNRLSKSLNEAGRGAKKISNKRRKHFVSRVGVKFKEHHRQCDQIGRFFELFGNKFAYKCCPKIMVNFWATSCKNDLATFWTILGIILFHHLVTLIIVLVM